MSEFGICWEGALQLSSRVRAGEISPTEVTETFVRAIERFNPPLNAVVTLDAERALGEAGEIEKRLAGGELRDSPLAGVPFLAKDLDVTAGLRTTFGSLIHREYVPRWDMFHIARLKAAGAILLGKTNTPEDGAIPNTYNPVFGATRNPWDLERGVGGSSGGSGAAVAAGLSPIATGSDGGGSIRIPASINGVFGIKPTFGLVPYGPKGIGIANTVGHLGPIARNVADAAAMLDAMAGGDERDRLSLPKGGSFLQAIKEAGPPEGRVAYSTDLGYGEVQAQVREIFGRRIESLADAGWRLEEASPEFNDPSACIETIIAFEWGTPSMMMAEQNREAFELQADYVQAMAEKRRRLTLDDLWAANVTRRNLAVAMGRFFERYDLLLTPTLTRAAWEPDRAWPRRADDAEAEEHGLNSMLYPFNLTGDPAASFPMGRTAEGLPVGLQIVGPRHEDARVLRAAAQIEKSFGPAETRPPHGVSE